MACFCTYYIQCSCEDAYSIVPAWVRECRIFDAGPSLQVESLTRTTRLSGHTAGLLIAGLTFADTDGPELGIQWSSDRKETTATPLRHSTPSAYSSAFECKLLPRYATRQFLRLTIPASSPWIQEQCLRSAAGTMTVMPCRMSPSPRLSESLTHMAAVLVLTNPTGGAFTHTRPL